MREGVEGVLNDDDECEWSIIKKNYPIDTRAWLIFSLLSAPPAPPNYRRNWKSKKTLTVVRFKSPTDMSERRTGPFAFGRRVYVSLMCVWGEGKSWSGNGDERTIPGGTSGRLCVRQGCTVRGSRAPATSDYATATSTSARPWTPPAGRGKTRFALHGALELARPSGNRVKSPAFDRRRGGGRYVKLRKCRYCCCCCCILTSGENGVVRTGPNGGSVTLRSSRYLLVGKLDRYEQGSELNAHWKYRIRVHV